jgi:alcohol/geraniol dehydrogenase (NADP+)
VETIVPILVRIGFNRKINSANKIAAMPTFHAYAASTAHGSFEPFDFDPGEIGHEEVEIEVSHCGICHSDLSMLNNDWGITAYPFVGGHEAVGTVVALGKGAKGLEIGQRVGVGWSACSCLSCHQCLSGYHNLCPGVQGTIVGRHGAFADRLRAQWTWVRPLPQGLEIEKVGPLFCGGITVFTPLLEYNTPPTARVGVIGIGGLGHLALQFANKWGCEVHAFTTSDDKRAEAQKLGAHYVHNTKQNDSLQKLAGSLDLIISTINVPLDVPGLLGALAPKGRLHTVGAMQKPLEVSVPTLIFGQKSISGSPTGSPTALDRMLAFCARHSIAPVTEMFPMSQVNEAFEHLRSGKARYRIVLSNSPK